MTTRDFHLPGRSPVYAREGMAATSHPLASLAAIETLKAGGTAADAAVAAVATLCVVEPAMTGIGGDCFCLVAKPGAPVWGYNGSGRAGGGGHHREAAGAEDARKIPATSPHAVTVPGAIEAWRRSSRRTASSVSTARCSARSAMRRTASSSRRASAATGPSRSQSLQPHAGSAKYYLPNGARAGRSEACIGFLRSPRP